jgi:hypothetical protein
VVSLKPLLLYPRGKRTLQYELNVRVCGPVWTTPYRREQILPLLRIEPKFIGSLSPVRVPTEKPWLHALVAPQSLYTKENGSQFLLRNYGVDLDYGMGGLF